jgi:hypothetical protein
MCERGDERGDEQGGERSGERSGKQRKRRCRAKDEATSQALRLTGDSKNAGVRACLRIAILPQSRRRLKDR